MHDRGVQPLRGLRHQIAGADSTRSDEHRDLLAGGQHLRRCIERLFRRNRYRPRPGRRRVAHRLVGGFSFLHPPLGRFLELKVVGKADVRHAAPRQRHLHGFVHERVNVRRGADLVIIYGNITK